MKHRMSLLCYCSLFLIAAIGFTELRAQSPFHFVDSANLAGLTVPHFDGGSQEPYLPALMVTGLALFDYDGDGWTDVYLLGECELFPNQKQSTPRLHPCGNTLYRNQGDGSFVDVTEAAGVRSGGFALGVVAADIDNDGDQDLATSNFGATELYINNGDGTFERVYLEASESKRTTPFGAGIACLDIDNDGFLDLFVSQYVDFSVERYNEVAPKSFPYPPGPKDFNPSIDTLYRSLGDGTFSDVSETSGISRFPGPSMGVVCGDLDGDNDADIFVCSDANLNQFFVNDGTGKFEDQALLAGLAFDVNGNANGSMGVEAGDYDNDGHIDLLITNYSQQLPVLYRNLGSGLFEDVSRRTRVGREVFAHTNWGVGLVDFDNDRDLDVFFANGHFLKNIKSIDDRSAYRVANTLMANDGRGRFSDVSKSSGPGLEVVESSRGAAFGDLDHDGDIDCVLLNANAKPTYLENRSPAIGSWIDIRLVGTRVNRDAVGAKVQIAAGGHKQVAMVHAGRGYQSHYGTILHFGLGTAASVDQIEVTWPGGVVESFASHATKGTLILVQGKGL